LPARYPALTRGTDANFAYVFTVSPKLADPVPGPRPAPELARYDQINAERGGDRAPVTGPALPPGHRAEPGYQARWLWRTLRAADSERADELWENGRATWSQAWAANNAALGFLQGTGLTRFSPVKPHSG
jgi:hypothetical protein